MFKFKYVRSRSSGWQRVASFAMMKSVRVSSFSPKYSTIFFVIQGFITASRTYGTVTEQSEASTVNMILRSASS